MTGNNSGRVTTQQHYEAIMQLRDEAHERELRIMDKLDDGFQSLEAKLVHRMDLQDQRIDRVASWEKVIGIVATVWPGLATVLGNIFL